MLLGALFPTFGLAQTGVVSTSVCADSYVLPLAAPDTIKALSWQAGSALSRAPKQLAKAPRARADAETLLALAPAQIILGPGEAMASTRLSIKRGAQVFALQAKADFPGIRNNISQLSQFLHQQAAGKTLLSDQRSRLEKLQQRTRHRSQKIKVLYLTPTLGTAGENTFVGAAITAAGGINLASEFGISGWGKVPVEHLAGQTPDLILTSFFTDGAPSVYQFRSHHFVLQQLRQNVPQVEIPGALWVCGGPLLINAAEQIADALDNVAKENLP
ncbi:hypothetical protein MNBD_ALPHA06-1975 [hydrothermal vent metagenome]|uniref:Fe/B12 periplasmic-binding domain-containing protein n=1 Tax=hydrothermal vent metagenome TaxID=652676 RepID=A0A3B0SBY9_9ZZZZ